MNYEYRLIYFKNIPWGIGIFTGYVCDAVLARGEGPPNVDDIFVVVVVHISLTIKKKSATLGHDSPHVMTTVGGRNHAANFHPPPQLPPANTRTYTYTCTHTSIAIHTSIWFILILAGIILQSHKLLAQWQLITLLLQSLPNDSAMNPESVTSASKPEDVFGSTSLGPLVLLNALKHQAGGWSSVSYHFFGMQYRSQTTTFLHCCCRICPLKILAKAMIRQTWVCWYYWMLWSIKPGDGDW